MYSRVIHNVSWTSSINTATLYNCSEAFRPTCTWILLGQSTFQNLYNLIQHLILCFFSSFIWLVFYTVVKNISFIPWWPTLRWEETGRCTGETHDHPYILFISDAIPDWSQSISVRFFVISFTEKKRPPIRLNYSALGHDIQRVSEINDLGAILSSDLNISGHVHSICPKDPGMLGLIKRCFNDLNSTDALLANILG